MGINNQLPDGGVARILARARHQVCCMYVIPECDDCSSLLRRTYSGATDLQLSWHHAQHVMLDSTAFWLD